MAQSSLRFPKKFLWGASVSTHQVEGGNHNQWSVWELETAQVKAAQAPYRYGQLPIWPDIKASASRPENYVSGQADDHFHRYEHDFELARRLHLTTLRSGIEWSRIEPQPGRFNQAAVDHYKTYFARLRRKGITPVVTLWHWGLPTWFAEQGGFARRRNVKYFVRYVEYLSEQLGEDWRYVITINEPTVYAAMSYHEGRWPPEGQSKLQMIWVLLNLARAHRKSYQVIKRLRPQAQVGLAHNCAYYYAGDSSWLSRCSAWWGHRLSNEFMINRVRRQQDFFGLNYYFANRMLGLRVHNPHEKRNDLGWDMQPDKLRPLLQQLHRRYRLPILITESGVADGRDQYRQWWLNESLAALSGALRDKVPVIGYIHWSLLDNFEWAEGFWPRFGLIAVNFKTQQRTVRPSAKWYGQLIKQLQTGSS